MATRKAKKTHADEMKPNVTYGQGLSYGVHKPREKVAPGTRPAFLSKEVQDSGTSAVFGAPKAKPASSRPKRDPNAAKNMMQEWCVKMTEEYENVEIEDFNTSWNDGLAFCALIHHFFPDAFDYHSLKPENRKQNFEVAFDAAKRLLDVEPIVGVEELAKMRTLDWKVVFTYIQSLYRGLVQKKLCTPMKPPEAQ